jgi:hypothetical protein
MPYWEKVHNTWQATGVLGGHDGCRYLHLRWHGNSISITPRRLVGSSHHLISDDRARGQGLVGGVNNDENDANECCSGNAATAEERWYAVETDTVATLTAASLSS